MNAIKNGGAPERLEKLTSKPGSGLLGFQSASIAWLACLVTSRNREGSENGMESTAYNNSFHSEKLHCNRRRNCRLKALI